MTSFELGFKKYAEECGLSEKKAAHIFKRSLDHPEAAEMLAHLPKCADVQRFEDLDTLANLLHQNSVDDHYSQIAKEINLR
jgi:hypothetical protein